MQLQLYLDMLTQYLGFHKLNIFTEIKLVIMKSPGSNRLNIHNFLTSTSNVFLK